MANPLDRALPAALALFVALVTAPAFAGPTVIATAEGQIGEMPGADDKVVGTRFESIRGQAGELVFGGIFVFGGTLPPPPEASFFTDRIHDAPNPAQVGAAQAGPFQIGIAQVGIAQIRPAKVRPLEIRRLQIAPAQGQQDEITLPCFILSEEFSCLHVAPPSSFASAIPL